MNMQQLPKPRVMGNLNDVSTTAPYYPIGHPTHCIETDRFIMNKYQTPVCNPGSDGETFKSKLNIHAGPVTVSLVSGL